MPPEQGGHIDDVTDRAPSGFSSLSPVFFFPWQSYESVSPGAWLCSHTSIHVQRGHASVEDPPGDAPGARASPSPYRVAHHHGNHRLCGSPARTRPPPLLLSCGAGAWRRWGPWELPLLPPTLSCLELCHLPDSHGEEEGGPGIWGALWVLAALLSPASYRHRPAGLCRGEWGPGEAHRVASNLCSVPFSTRDTLPHKHLPSNVFYYVLN